MNTFDAGGLTGSRPGGRHTEPVERKVLTSATQGIHLETWGISQEELPLATTAAWSVKKYTLCGGRQAGVDVIEVDNGRLRLVVAPTRGMSILRVESGDVRLGWDSPVKEVVHPQFIHLESRGGLGWLEGFNEWLVRCGLEWAGHPGKDRFRNNVGEEVEMELTLHGKIGNIPASEAEGYVTGLEPGTGFPATRRRERAAGRVPTLAPGETRHFVLDVAIQSDRAEVAAAAERVRRIQGERAVVLDRQTLD